MTTAVETNANTEVTEYSYNSASDLTSPTDGKIHTTIEIANNRYRAGLVTYLEVATAQTAALTRERSLVQLQGQRLAASAGLVRAIGGGWSGP